MSLQSLINEIPAFDHHCHATAYEDDAGLYRSIEEHERIYARGLVEAEVPASVFRDYLDAERRSDTDRLTELDAKFDMEARFERALEMRSTTVFAHAMRLGTRRMYGDELEEHELRELSRAARREGSVILYGRALDLANTSAVLTDIPSIDHSRWDPARYRWISRVDPFLYPFGPGTVATRGDEVQNFHRRFAAVLDQYMAELDVPRIPDTLGEYLDFIKSAISWTIDAGAVGFKIVSAYVRGLDFRRTSHDLAADVYAECRRGILDRRADLENYLLFNMLEIVADSSLPVQIHVGMGHSEPGMNYFGCNPLHLQPLLNDEALHGVRFVLIHGGYPYSSEVATLAHAYGNVFMDFSWMPYLHRNFLADRLSEWLELLPTNKLLFGTDTGMPEVQVGSTELARTALGVALHRGHKAGLWDHKTVERLANRCLHQNLEEVYGLGWSA